MRRRPNEPNSQNTNVFSSDSWSTAPSSNYVGVQPEEVKDQDLKEFAAKTIPQGASRSARAGRYAPSANSAYYDQGIAHNTNSDQDPFQSAVLETRHVQPQPQNARVADMPQPVRKDQLGANRQFETATPVQTPQQPAPTQYVQQSPAPAPTNYVPQTPAQAPQAPQQQPAPTQYVQQSPAPTQYVQQSPAPAPTNYVPQTPTQAPQQPTTQATINEEVQLSDFELEFQAKQIEEEQNQIEVTEIDLNSLEKDSNASVQFAAPALFPTGTIPETSPSNDFFNSPTQAFAGGDQFYEDDLPKRQTVQIDLDFILGAAKRFISSKAAIVVVGLVLAVAAFFIVSPMVSGSNETNAPSVNIESPAGSKTVIPDPSTVPGSTELNGTGQETPPQNIGEPQTPAPVADPAAPEDEFGPTVVRDQDGNIVYSSETNQSFNGM